MFLVASRFSYTCLEREEGYSVGCNLQPHQQMPLNPTDWTFKWSVHSNDQKNPYFPSCSSLSLDEFNSNTSKSLSMSSLIWSGCVCSCVLSVPAMDHCGFSVTAQCSVMLLPARDLQTADAWHNPADAEHTVVSHYIARCLCVMGGLCCLSTGTFGLL